MSNRRKLRRRPCLQGRTCSISTTLHRVLGQQLQSLLDQLLGSAVGIAGVVVLHR
jgi:hypothetical protein